MTLYLQRAVGSKKPEVMRKILTKLIRGILDRKANTHASSIAFYFFMAFIPLLILFMSIVPLLGISVDSTVRFFQTILPEGSAKLAEDIVREAYDHSSAAFSLSAVILLWTASRGVNALAQGLNTMYDEKETRGAVRLILQALGYTMVLLAFLSSAIFLIFSGKISAFLKSAFPQIRLQAGVMTFLEYLLLLVAGCLFFCLVYRYMPSGKRVLARQFPGAFLASSGWVLFSMGLRVYVSMFNSFTRLYGSLATVILLLFWFYWIFFILLAGGYVNAHLAELLPAGFLSFYHEKKALSLTVSGLFLAGFFSYLTECWLNCRLYAVPWIGYLLVLFRAGMLGSWMAAVLISLKAMGLPYTRKQLAVLVLLMAGNIIVMRRSFFPNLFVYLITFTIWNAVILCMCAYLMLREEPDKNMEEGKGA